MEEELARGPEHANNVVTLLKALRGYAGGRTPAPVALACTHALRRVLVRQADGGLISRAVRDATGEATDPAVLFKQWNRKQYLGFIDALLEIMTVRCRVRCRARC